MNNENTEEKHGTGPLSAPSCSALERGITGKILNRIRSLAMEERDKQNAAGPTGNMHGYAANCLESILLSFGVSKNWPNAKLRDGTGAKKP